ncbi:11064_t:CDS:2 [Paraglomus brasilianum]|uniref:11064_t:CDS:1 n=1 Tax=Paraglomus brasilianum TaxID=144538 RepID=A0A9N9CR50_9GLOM|nr:11064_t:CDS:2 [Paraglomus brasilianum]
MSSERSCLREKATGFLKNRVLSIVASASASYYSGGATTESTEVTELESHEFTASREELRAMEQHCILIPTYAFLDPESDGMWSVRVRGWAYSMRKSRKRSLLLGVARKVTGVTKDDVRNRHLEERVGMFLAKNLRHQHYTVEVTGVAQPTHMELDCELASDYEDEQNFNNGPLTILDSKNATLVDEDDLSSSGSSDGNGDCSGESEKVEVVEEQDLAEPVIHVTSNTGHFSGKILIPTAMVDKWIAESSDCRKSMRLLQLHATPEGRRKPHVSPGLANLVELEGLSIISDIDDTIKETNIGGGARVVLHNTFLHETKEVPGMANVYMNWYNRGASFHYVSNSPWQLFPMLTVFFHTKKFPPGSAHLKFYNDLVKALLDEPQRNKRDSILEILKDFPKRKFILIGDSGEIDMDIYSAIAKEHPNQIHHIFIRDVSTERLKNLPAPPAKRSRSFPFIPSRTSSSNSFKSSKSMPAIVTNPNAVSELTALESPVSPSSEDMSPLDSPEYHPTDCPKTPLEEFYERVEKCRAMTPNGAFTMFKDATELEHHEALEAAFELVERL